MLFLMLEEGSSMRDLSDNDVRQGLNAPKVIHLVESVYTAKSENNTETWPTIF